LRELMDVLFEGRGERIAGGERKKWRKIKNKFK
jgi:hypothetical protein